MPRTIKTNQLRPQETFMVRGRVSFCRVAKHIEGEALKRDIENRKRLGRNAIERPYTTLTIYDAQVVPKNPSQLTMEEQYANEAMFKSSSAQNTGMCFTGVNKSRRLPWVGILEGCTVKQLDGIPSELAIGMDVTLVMRVFSAPQNNGVSLDGVICNEPIRYFSGVDLTGYGLTFESAPGHVSEDADPAPAPGPDMGQPVAPPVGDPYSAQPAAAPVAPAPGAPQVPYPAGMQPPAPGPYTQGQPAAQPAPPPPAPAGGIRYDPAQDASRQY